jgi:hypothetical protein
LLLRFEHDEDGYNTTKEVSESHRDSDGPGPSLFISQIEAFTTRGKRVFTLTSPTNKASDSALNQSPLQGKGPIEKLKRLGW